MKTSQGNGMVMSLALFYHQGTLTLLAAFENGFASVHRLERDGQWTTTYRSQAHAQPILSLDVHPNREYFLTSAADAVVAKHPIPTSQQEVTVFNPDDRVVEIDDSDSQQPSLLSASLGQSSAQGIRRAASGTFKAWEHPLKVVNTKHSGQQSLRIRSDGRIFATAGWDSRIRVYASKTMKELAVLQWHKVGCYAIAFADLLASEPASEPVGKDKQSPDTQAGVSTAESNQVAAVLKQPASVKDRRIQQAKTAHWIAAGAKDGKISLWDIY